VTKEIDSKKSTGILRYSQQTMSAKKGPSGRRADRFPLFLFLVKIMGEKDLNEG
jgi:hypothetical protein